MPLHPCPHCFLSPSSLLCAIATCILLSHHCDGGGDCENEWMEGVIVVHGSSVWSGPNQEQNLDFTLSHFKYLILT